MKRFLALTTLASFALSGAATAFAMPNTTLMPRLSRRLLESEAISRQRVPSGAMPVDLLLRVRKEAQQNTTGRAALSRSRIQTRIRTVRGGRPEDQQYWKLERPSRRSIIEQGEESLLGLPATLVETGGKGSRMFSHATRRTVRAQTEKANVVKVQAAVHR